MDKHKEFWHRLEIAVVHSRIKSLRNLCRITGVCYQSMVNTKSKNRFPKLETLVVLAEAMNCSIDWLITGNKDYAPYSFSVFYSIPD